MLKITQSFVKRSFSTTQTVLSGTSRQYIDQIYCQWLKDPKSVDVSWRNFFQDFQQENTKKFEGKFLAQNFSSPLNQVEKINGKIYSTDFLFKMYKMVEKFRNHGHYISNLDPLNIYKDTEKNRLFTTEDFNLKSFEFFEDDLQKPIKNLKMTKLPEKYENVEQLRQALFEIYCGQIGFELNHIEKREEIEWLHEKIENKFYCHFENEEKRVILDRLGWACLFEKFLHLKWSVQKRFGLDGTESMIPSLKTIIDTSSDLGVRNVVIGMPHRGRLNVLANVLLKPMEQIFAEFSGADMGPRLGSGDVKYHMGCSNDRVTKCGNKIHISMVANPSHLEACNPVVLGKARAKIDYSGDENLTGTLPLLIHGDAAFYGQGIVYESLMLSDFYGFRTGGVIHLICNNQIGYTTDPLYTRRSKYCTNVGRSFGAPIFHVNANDIEAVVSVSKLASAYRQKFQRDVVIDLVGYRKYGHNEGDEPRFTQPFMYSRIRNIKNQLEIYESKLISEKTIKPEEAAKNRDRITKIMEERFEKSKNYKNGVADWLDANWRGFLGKDKHSEARKTGCEIDDLKQVGLIANSFPENFVVHKRLNNVLQQRKKAILKGIGIDWGLAESLALGTLLKEGIHVRISGQDVQRGTFSHRHSVLVDQSEGYPQKIHVPLKSLPDPKGKFNVLNSPLSEFGVLGYEYGYSLESPKSLVIWEAQFGDFSNEAQVIFDQFISSAESKWLRQSGIVILLPHGYEGGGPEHSSARLERFLQMCSDSLTEQYKNEISKETFKRKDRFSVQNCNWQIVNCTTPANYFHVLRRQIHRNFRKPLVLFSPKSLLKLRECVSNLEDFAKGTKFLPIITERELKSKNSIKRVLFCSGKIYFELAEERKKLKIDNVAIITLEQISPFPYDEILTQIVDFYPNSELMWVQEEPMNMGAFSYVKPRLEMSLSKIKGESRKINYVGRPASAATATGFGMKQHKLEIAEILKAAFAK